VSVPTWQPHPQKLLSVPELSGDVLLVGRTVWTKITSSETIGISGSLYGVRHDPRAIQEWLHRKHEVSHAERQKSWQVQPDPKAPTFP
jgi:hypothetical protein